MEFLWQPLTLLVGFVVGYFLYSKFNFRGGGVLVTPLLVIYLIEFPLMFPFIIISSFLSIIILYLVFSKLLIYGRRLLYLSLGIGLVTSLVFQNLLNTSTSWYPMLIPGLLAYNLHREFYTPNKFLKSVGLLAVYAFIVFLTAISGYYFL